MMMKKLIKILGGLIGFIVIILVAAGIAIMIIVDKPFIEDQISSALHRHVVIEEINAGIFSAVSGIEVKKVFISNYKTPAQLKNLKGKKVPPGDTFVELKAFVFKVQLLPLLKKQLKLNQLVLYGPVINVVKSKDGSYNFDDLLKQNEETVKKSKQKDEPAPPKKGSPLRVDDLPVALSVGKIGLEKGRVTYLDRTYDQRFELYHFDALVHSIKIDPAALDKKNELRVDVSCGVKTIGQMKSGSVKSFDIGFSIKSKVKPFNVKTRELDPEVEAKAGMPHGTLTGLQIYEKLKEVEALTKYIGKVGFLKDKVSWKDAFVEASYKSGTVTLKDGTIQTSDADFAYSGKVNIDSKATDIKLDMALAEKHNKQIRSNLEKNIKKVIKGKLAKIIKPSVVVDEAMKPLVNKEGKVYLGYAVTGTSSKPVTKLVHPKLPSLDSVARDSAGNVGDQLKDKAKDEAKKVIDKTKEKAADEIKKAEDKVKDKAKDEGKKNVKSLKKKLKL